jgi:hypothetical protein
MKYFYVLVMVFAFFIFSSCRAKRSGIPLVLVYSQHLSGTDSKAAVKAIQHLGELNDFKIHTTDTCLSFADDSLPEYAAVLFLNRSAMDLDGKSRVALQRFIVAGGGFAGIHSKVKTGDFKWYGDMIGCDGDSSVSFIHQKYDGGRAIYTCDSLCAKNVNDRAVLKNTLNEIEYAIGHFEPLDYNKSTARLQ